MSHPAGLASSGRSTKFMPKNPATSDSGSMMAAYTVRTLVTSVAWRASAPR